MGDKYIIELEDKPFYKEDGDFLYRVKGFNSLVFDMTGISKLTPYTEPDLEQVREEAYEEGYDDAKGGYAWDAAKVGKEFQMGERKCVVTHIIDGTQCRVLWDNGVSSLVGNTDLFVNLTPTGRYFPEVATVLEKMRGEQDG